MFEWHEKSTIYAGNRRIARPARAAACGFRNIPAQPTLQAMGALADALIAGDGFCISQMPIPPDLTQSTRDFLTLSGGTSGTPKVISRTHASWIATFEKNAEIFDIIPTDSIAVLGQLSHSLALYGLLEAIHLGMDAHALDMMRPTRQHAQITAQKINVLYATPTQLRLLIAGAKGALLPDVRLILCGGGSLDPATSATISQLCPNAKTHQFYGAAETSFITLNDPNTPEGSVGQAYPGVTLHIRDGEVWVQSPYLFKGYVQGNSQDTRWDGNLLSVGEMGDLDAAGNLWLRGRKTRMISVADQNVFPEEIESFIAGLPDVTACCVLGHPDTARGNRIIAILQGTTDTKLADDILTQCRARFGPLIAPHRVLFHDCFPMLASGKADFQTLATWMEEQL